MKIGDKVHCTAYAKRIGQGISVMDYSPFDDVRGKEVVYFDTEKNDLESIPYSDFTDVTTDKFKIIEKEFDGIYVGTTRLATKLTATYETPPHGNDYVRFESECYKEFAVVYYANNKKRFVPVDCFERSGE